MLIRDTAGRYGLVSVLLHWIVAVAVSWLLYLGYTMMPLSRAESRELKGLHSSIGFVVLPFIISRILWRAYSGKPSLPPQRPALAFAASWTWKLLLACLAIQMITGPMLVMTRGYRLEAFGVVLSPPLLPRMDWLHDRVVLPIHDWGAYTLTALIALHVLGALKHALFDADGVLARMLWPVGARPTPRGMKIIGRSSR